MKSTSYYPVIMTDDVAGSAAFYMAHFRFRPVFQSDWYVHLTSSEDRRVNLAILDGSHETIPAIGRGRVSGLILNFEVKDVDAEYARVQQANLPIHLAIRSLRPAPFHHRRSQRRPDRHHQADPAQRRVRRAICAGCGFLKRCLRILA